jgi:hypothetical protein
LDRPNGDGSTPGTRRLRNLRAVHEPDRHVAAGILPKNVALAIAIKTRPPRICARSIEPPGFTLNAMADKLTTTPLTSDSPFPP